jgi:TRAP-type uncharacterized transport system substrate-binding protein
MVKPIRFTRLALRDLALTAGPFVLLTLALLVLAYLVLKPTPPHRVVLATGVSQGAYNEFGKRYAELLKQHGISVELRATQGAAENLALLRDPDSGVDLAFMQGGADSDPVDAAGAAERDAALVSLGSVFYEPIWLFYRQASAQRLTGGPTLTRLSQLTGGTFNIGAPGSGAPPLMQRLLAANHIEPGAITLQRQSTTPAVVDLLEGRIDALALASAPEALMVQMLLQTPGIGLFDFNQAEAYARRFPFMSPVLLPRGVVDLARDLPPADVRLVAPTATLVARDSLHPALVQLFVQAAQQVHGGAGWFQHKGDFPTAANTERPLAPEAARLYRNGVPWLQRYLPFWLANLADRMWLALLTIIAVLIPLAKVVPPLYEFRIRSRVFRWYAQLRDVEAAQGQRDSAALLAELDAIEAHVGRIHVPLSYTDELYALRGHIHMVRDRLLER